MATPDAPPPFVDDKSPICIPFILERLAVHQKEHPDTPFIIGLNGVQGVGKTTLVRALADLLQQQQHLQTLVVSIDDFYLTHADQVALAASHPDNALVQNRGEPGTHDIPLLTAFFEAIVAGQPTKVPQYDKSQFQGQGDRAPSEASLSVNEPGQPRVQVVIFEGWCVGFRALASAADVEAKWRTPGTRTLHKHRLEHLLFVNEQLRAYDAVTDRLDAFIHLDALDTVYVYAWRQQQEAELRRVKGSGMTDEEVIRFVDAYYPAYELFAGAMRKGIFADQSRQHMRIVVDQNRRVIESTVIGKQ